MAIVTDKTTRTGIWTGPAYPFKKGVDGAIGPKSDDEVISTAIQNTLKTKIGSWSPDPSVGSHIYDLIFEPLDDITIQLIQYYTFKDLQDQIPLIEMKGVTVDDSRAEEHLVIVHVAYIRRSDPLKKVQQTAVVFDKREAA